MAAAMAVPEASIDKQCCLPRRENDIGCSGERSDVETISPAARVQKPPDDHLGLGIAPFDAGMSWLRSSVESLSTIGYGHPDSLVRCSV